MKIEATDRIGMVWSGGGARGSYQMGMWKAMRELGIDKQVTVLTGTSIGAINGLAFVQGAYDLSLKIWKNMDYDQVFDSMPKKANTSTAKVLFSLAKDFVRKRGISVDISRNRVKNIIDEQAVRNAKIDFGLVVYNWTKRQGEKLFVDEIPKGLLADYVNASGNLPFFEKLEINGDKYVDGGLSEVVPLSLCFRRADKFDKLIVANINSFSYRPLHNRKSVAGKELHLFSPISDLGSPIDFSPEAIQYGMQLGYQETMEALDVEVGV